MRVGDARAAAADSLTDGSYRIVLADDIFAEMLFEID